MLNMKYTNFVAENLTSSYFWGYSPFSALLGTLHRVKKMKKEKNSLHPSCRNLLGLTWKIVNLDDSNEVKTVKKNWDNPQPVYTVVTM